ncbi:hypothetical protein H9L19_08190 [Weissella diestrammenae]|uniref:Uncharacterized protein n=1 Tax=Weissella diestrammenae TaxID=1162633 RepID=A0A7G9T5F2_9LACO|nr:hypothetical protein [Weissella diestrammenae]MCM0583186.1 hypothetical protein [Weissella diestrammenae]QNN75327.1 hypothetical protein H9L19_08190 [Weissella diestrammenae]
MARWHIVFWLAALLVVIIIAVRINRIAGRRETEKNIIHSQQIINLAMKTVITQESSLLGVALPVHVSSTLVANIWGYNVMAFEFIFPVAEQEVKAADIKLQLNRAFERYAQQNELSQVDHNFSAIVVTDVWFDQIKPVLHIDVAHVATEQTAAYLRDLQKLNQPFQT